MRRTDYKTGDFHHTNKAAGSKQSLSQCLFFFCCLTLCAHCLNTTQPTINMNNQGTVASAALVKLIAVLDFATSRTPIRRRRRRRMLRASVFTVCRCCLSQMCLQKDSTVRASGDNAFAQLTKTLNNTQQRAICWKRNCCSRIRREIAILLGILDDDIFGVLCWLHECLCVILLVGCDFSTRL